MALVASFSGSTTGVVPANGEQIVFFQVVVGPLTGLTAGGVYTVTHPYGVLTNLVANSSGTIPVQRQDIGCAAAPCDFTEVLGSAIGPFLQWDTGAPAGFVGNPATAHTVVGSPFGTNVFHVEGLNAGGLESTPKKQTFSRFKENHLQAPCQHLWLWIERHTPAFSSTNRRDSDVIALRSPYVELDRGSFPVTMTTDGMGSFLLTFLIQLLSLVPSR